MTKISVIIPVYNSEKYLHKCIDSVLAQTYQDFELILINDGSKDNSLDICDKFAQGDIRIKVVTQENQGVSVARNRGLKLASGKYIMFIDSDDFIDTDYLKTFVDKLSERDFDFVVAGVRHVDEKDNVLREFISEANEATTKENIGKLIPKIEIDSLLGGPVSKVFKNELIKKNGISFNADIQFGEDQIFNIQYLMLCSSLVVVNYIGYNYIQRTSDSLVKKKHSYEKTNNIANELYNIRINAIKYFNIEDHEYRLLNERKHVLLKTAALLRIYQNKFRKTKAERIVCIQIYLNEIDTKTIPNTSIHYRFLKLILNVRNLKMIDVLLNLYTKLTNI